MDRSEMKRRVCEAIDRHRDVIIALGRTIRDNPELGFKEHKTAATVAKMFAAYGIPCQEKLAITGVKGILTAGARGPRSGSSANLIPFSAPTPPSETRRRAPPIPVGTMRRSRPASGPG